MTLLPGKEERGGREGWDGGDVMGWDGMGWEGWDGMGGM